MATNLVDHLKKTMDALMKNDWTTYRTGMTDNIHYEEEATHRRVDGADEFIKLVKEWKSVFPDLKVNIKQAYQSGDAVIAELEWNGTHKGALSGPFGSIPPSNKAVKMPAVLVQRFDGDKVRESRHYFDLMTMLAQIGAMPQPQPGAQPSR